MGILSKIITISVALTVILPTAFFAIITTFLAFSVLLFRCTLIYIDLAVAVIPHYLLGGAFKIITPVVVSQWPSQTSPPITRRRRRRTSSTSSTLSVSGLATPIGHSATEYAVMTSPNSVIGLNLSVGPTRDFEGVGGWRHTDHDEEGDALWSKINSRLELPADHGGRHKRSLTGGSLPLSAMAAVKLTSRNEDREAGTGGGEVKSNTGKARTPSTNALSGAAQGEVPLEKGVLMMGGKKRTASSGSSGSSKSSSLIMKAR